MNEKTEYGFIYHNGSSVQVELTDGRTAGFPGLGEDSWKAAITWTEGRAEEVEIRSNF